MYTYLRVHLHIIPPISPPQVDNGPAESYCCSAGKPNRGQTWVDNLWSQLSPKSAEKGAKPLPLCLSLLMLCSGKVSTLPALWSTMEVAASHPSLL